MAITAKQFESLQLTASEFDSLGLTTHDYDNFPYSKFLELIELRLNREVPASDEAIFEYAKTMKATLEYIYSDMKNAKKRERKLFFINLAISLILGIITGLISSFFWYKIGLH